eukprot:scaffold116023_cov63-Phaeocystis_antarctica.AAC.3
MVSARGPPDSYGALRHRHHSAHRAQPDRQPPHVAPLLRRARDCADALRGPGDGLQGDYRRLPVRRRHGHAVHAAATLLLPLRRGRCLDPRGSHAVHARRGLLLPGTRRLPRLLPLPGRGARLVRARRARGTRPPVHVH